MHVRTATSIQLHEQVPLYRYMNRYIQLHVPPCTSVQVHVHVCTYIYLLTGTCTYIQLPLTAVYSTWRQSTYACVQNRVVNNLQVESTSQELLLLTRLIVYNCLATCTHLLCNSIQFHDCMYMYVSVHTMSIWTRAQKIMGRKNFLC